MKIALEIKPTQHRQHAMGARRLRRPKENRRKERADEQGASEVEQESGCVFHEG